MNRVQFNSSWIDAGTKFVLHEAEPPAGYEIADDIEFKMPAEDPENIFFLKMEE